MNRHPRSRHGTIARALVALVVACAALGVPHSAASSDGRFSCSLSWGLMVTSAPWDDRMTDIRTVDTELNRHAQIVHWYAQWGDPGAGTFSANQPRLLTNAHNYNSVGVTGSTPLITWEPWGPHYTANSTDFPLSNIAAGQYDSYIDSWANGLRTFGYDVLLDWGHEMNGVWYPWGANVNGNTPAQYIAAFRHIHDRFALAGATNVKFVWNLVQWSPAGIPPAAFYPGDAYVDWLAIDTYNWNSAWGTPWDVIHPIYDQVTSVNSTKPIMIAEIGSEASPPSGSYPATQAAWITLLGQTLSSFPRINSMVWFNQLNTPLALDSSAATLTAAQSAFGGCD